MRTWRTRPCEDVGLMCNVHTRTCEEIDVIDILIYVDGFLTQISRAFTSSSYTPSNMHMRGIHISIARHDAIFSLTLTH